MFGWDMLPGYDIYIWLDASFRLSAKHSIHWFFRLSAKHSIHWFASNLGYCDLAIFRHPKRRSIAEEALFIAHKIEKQSPYLTGRYEGEDMEGQLRAIGTDGFEDDTLYATMAFAYHPDYRVKRMLTDWWVHTSRFHSVDQLALPYLVWDHGCSVAILEGDPYHSPWIEYTRGGPRA
jgi:hypothetical protein